MCTAAQIVTDYCLSHTREENKLTCCCENRMVGEKNPLGELCFLGDFLNHTVLERKHSRHMETGRGETERGSVGQAGVCVCVGGEEPKGKAREAD